jgi:hypothetical protein
MRLSNRWALVLAVAVLGCSEDAAPSTMMSPSSSASGAGAGTAGVPDKGTAGAGATSGTTGSTTASGGAGKASAAGATAVAGTSGVAGESNRAGSSGAAGTPGSGALGGAGESGAAGTAGTGNANGVDLDALKTTGIDKYVGAAKPASMQPGANGVTTYTFDVADGPRCLRGDAYSMATRDQGSDNLVIYLQGGGSCSSAVCSANTTASVQLSAAGLTSTNAMQTPVASWNLVYVPYCDGSLHLGDKDHESESPPRYHHGLRNLSAALDVGVAAFPKPKQILLSGSSAGGLGTIYASILVRLLYPEATLFVFNDSGVGVSTPDGARAKLTRDEWGTEQLIPASCPECKASPHSTPIIAWNLAHDPGLRVGIFSAYEDTVIADTFLMIGGPAFKQALLDETGKVVMAYPERAKRFYIEGTKHTTAGNLQATMVNGVNIGQWLEFMLTGDAKWTDTLQ